MKMYKKYMNVLMAAGLLIACAPAQGSVTDLCVDPLVKTFGARTIMGIASWYAVVRAMQYGAQRYKKDLPNYQGLTPKLKTFIENRFSLYKPCKLLIKQSPSLEGQDATDQEQGSTDQEQGSTDQESIGARTYFFGNTACLELPQSFLGYSALQQQALIAHEATHYSKNHIAKQMRLLALCLGVGSALVSLQPSYLQKFFAAGASFLTYRFVSSIQMRMHEKEADLADKTLEELYVMICALDKEAFLNFQKDNSLFRKSFTEVYPSSFLDAYHTKNERIVYLMDQYEKQIANKIARDIPKTADDCKKALGYYLTDEQIQAFRNDTDACKRYCQDQHLLENRLEQLFKSLGASDISNTVTKSLKESL